MRKKYQIILADPPWSYNRGVYQETFPKRKQVRKERNLLQQYQIINKNELQRLPVKNITSDNCALFLWVVDSHLKEGIKLIELWGFSYRTIVFVWKKITNNRKICANIGAWTMKNCEVCLLSIKGNMLQYKQKNNVYQLIEATRTNHSKKPIETKKRIVQLFGDLPRIELFAREKTLGWDVWGNEVESDIELKGE